MPNPQNEYRTELIWSGLKRLDPTTQRCHIFSPAGEYVDRTEIKYPDHLSRVDCIEHAHVRVYNENMYAENDELFVKYAIELEDSHSNLPQPVEVDTHPLRQTPQQ